MISDNPEIFQALESFASEVAQKEAMQKASHEAAKVLERQADAELARAALQGAEETRAREESLAKDASLQCTYDILKACEDRNGKRSVSLEWENPPEWIPDRISYAGHAESIHKTHWQLHEIDEVAILEISRTFYFELGAWDTPHYVPTADLWLYSANAEEPFVATTNKHGEPRRLNKTERFRPGSWQDLSTTLSILYEAVVQRGQTKFVRS